MKKSNVFNGIGGSMQGEKMCMITQEVGNQQHKRPDANVDRVQMLACLSVSW
jgi:hypothetical protein